MKANNLLNEKSPYLLQHAYNPVDWYPWNDEAISKAKSENKPIFLSIGYSSCYWCHVMEREVFENESIAKRMNEYFVNIKVDREERPDLDRIYMTALQAMTGSGGWPMSMFLTPNFKPFYGATYIPPRAKYGRSGFEDVIEQIHIAWTERSKDVIKSSDDITEHLQKFILNSEKSKYELSEEIINNAFRKTIEYYDEEFGGFGKGNKFPRPSVFNFLLTYYYFKKDFKALDIVTYTLKKMHDGGMYDHLGGGFHRYSVDHFWRVPHFEKMLYDQAQLICTYLDTFLITRNKFFLETAEDVLKYVIDNLKNPEGGFYSAEDAESLPSRNAKLKEEGAFYLWTSDELQKILGAEDYAIFKHYFGIQNHGNTVNDPHGVFGRKNVLFMENDEHDTAKKFGKTADDIKEIIDACKEKLIHERSKRPKPFLDNKILTSWNGLMIAALSKAFQVTGKREYLEAAKSAAEFILLKLYDKESRNLLHRFRENDSKFSGTLEDYAYFISGLLELYESDFGIKYLQISIELSKRADELFYDQKNGGFFDTDSREANIILKTKDIYDGAEPSGNSVQIMNLLRLGNITGDDELINKAEKSLILYSGDLERMPFSSPSMLCSLGFYLNSPKEIVITGKNGNEKFNTFLDLIHKTYMPNKVLMHANEELKKISEFISEISGDGNEDKVFVCENFKCNLPITELAALKKLLLKTE